MKKLLHERLREWADSTEGDKYPSTKMLYATIESDHAPLGADDERKAFHLLANEIEKYYIPRPRFEDGEPVQFGDEFADCSGGPHTLHDIRYRDKAAAGLGAKCLLEANTTSPKDYDGISFNLWDGQTVKRPEPKVLDADGMPTKKGDRVWDITQEVRDNPFCGGELLVVDVTEDNIVVTPSPGCGATMSAPSSCFSHTRPQYDCNGVLCKRGDIVFGLGREQHRYKVISEELDVEKCEPYNHGRFTLPCLDLTEGDESVCFLDPRMVSHKEPGSYEELQEMLREESPKGDGDSYEKLRDDLKRKYGSNSPWVKRLTAIMERDA